MNKLKIVKYLLISFLIAIIILVMLIYIYEKDLFNAYRLLNENKIDVIHEENKKINFNPKTKKGEEIFVEVLYEGLTVDELALKLNKSLKSNLKGTGNLFAKYSIEYEVDPYLAVSISLLETGCKWGCSRLVRECNNVGGMKGNPGCFGGNFRKFETLEDGIEAFIKLLSTGYYKKGLTTPELMEKKYAGGSNTWAAKVNNYINQVKEA